VDEGLEEAGAGGVSGREGGLQPVAQRHQGIDLGDHAVLFGEGRDVNFCRSLSDCQQRGRRFSRDSSSGLADDLQRADDGGLMQAAGSESPLVNPPVNSSAAQTASCLL